MATALYIYGVVAIIGGIITLIKFLSWKISGTPAQCRFLEMTGSQEKKVGGLMNKKTVYDCTYRVGVIGAAGTAEKTCSKTFDTIAEAEKLVGTQVECYTKGNGSFVEETDYQKTRKNWLVEIGSGVLSIVLAFILIAAVHAL